MKLFSNVSLRQKLVGIILGVSFLGLAVGFAFVLLNRIHSYKAQFIEEVGIHAELAARHCLASLKTRDAQETARILSQLQVIPYMKDGIVYGIDQEVIAAFRAGDEEFNPPYPEEEMQSAFIKGNLHVIRLIQDEESSYGKLYLRASSQELDRQILFFVITLAALLGFLQVIVFFLARAAQGMVSKPILGLVNATKKVSGTYDSDKRGKKRVKDEIKILRERFNYILENAPVFAGMPVAGVVGAAEKTGGRAEETTGVKEEIFKELFDHMSLAVMVLEGTDNGKDFLVKDFNKGGEKMERIHRADMIGKRVTEIFPGVKRHGLLEAIKKVWETGYEVYHPLAQYKEVKREEWKESHIYRLPSGEIVVVFNDITARKLEEEAKLKQAELSVSEAQKPAKPAVKDKKTVLIADNTAQLEGSQKELEALFYAVANDLGIPLEGIDQHSKALLEDYAGSLDDKGKNYLIQIRAASHRMNQLFNDISQLSQLSLDELRVEQVDLSYLARRKALELKEGNPDRKVEFAIQEGVSVQGDARLLALVIDHLFTNAWLYTAKMPLTQIEFGSHQDKARHVEFYVKDNGTGFDMENSDKIFMPFQRLHADEVYPGAGMGLAITRRIIHRHGGVMRVEAEPGKGSVFYFTLSPKSQKNR